jgi:hypothetical protein
MVELVEFRGRVRDPFWWCPVDDEAIWAAYRRYKNPFVTRWMAVNGNLEEMRVSQIGVNIVKDSQHRQSRGKTSTRSGWGEGSEEVRK